MPLLDGPVAAEENYVLGGTVASHGGKAVSRLNNDAAVNSGGFILHLVLNEEG